MFRAAELVMGRYRFKLVKYPTGSVIYPVHNYIHDFESLWRVLVWHARRSPHPKDDFDGPKRNALERWRQELINRYTAAEQNLPAPIDDTAFIGLYDTCALSIQPQDCQTSSGWRLKTAALEDFLESPQ